MIDIGARKKLICASGEFTLDVRLRLGTGKFAALFGESGAGKTTLPRIGDKIILLPKTFSPMLVAVT